MESVFEDPKMDIAGGLQHPVCGAGDGIIAEHDQEVSEGRQPTELPTSGSAGSAQTVQRVCSSASGAVRSGYEAPTPGTADGPEAL